MAPPITAVPTLSIAVADPWPAIAEAFQRDGIVVLTDALPPATVEELREEEATLRHEVDAALALCGQRSHAGTTIGQCYSIAGRHAVRPALCRLIAGPLMQRVCAATIGDQAYLFTDQFLVKGPKSAMDFNWHQDGAYVPPGHDPFVVIWLPLDDVGTDNGTIRAIPFGRLPERTLRPHEAHPQNTDLVGYRGDDPGDPVVCGAGAVVAFDSRLLHCSDDNRSDRWRRVYQIRYTPQPLTGLAPGPPVHFAKHVFGS